MATVFRLHGRATVALADPDPARLAIARSEFDPYPPCEGSGDDALLVLERAAAAEIPSFEDVQNPAGDGIVTAAAGGHSYVLIGDAWCALPQTLEEPRLVYREGFPLGRLFRSLLRPALQVAMPARGSVAVHATAVEIDGRALLVGGWSESGKTETALAFLEDGARFLSDKWTIVTADGVAGVFPVSVGIRRWMLSYAPRLRGSLPIAARVQLAAAAVAAALARPVRGRRPGSRIAAVLVEGVEHAVGLADRAALSPSQLRSAYGEPSDAVWKAPVGALALLTTVPEGQGIAVADADPAWAAARLAHAAAFERRGLFDLYERARYACPEHASPRVESECADERLLTTVLSTVRVLDVRAPFPADPRHVAEAIRRAL